MLWDCSSQVISITHDSHAYYLWDVLYTRLYTRLYDFWDPSIQMVPIVSDMTATHTIYGMFSIQVISIRHDSYVYDFWVFFYLNGTGKPYEQRTLLEATDTSGSNQANVDIVESFRITNK